MCRRCMLRTTRRRTSTLDSPVIRDVVGRLQSEVPDTCLKDLCSIHSRAWMVHKRNLLFRFALPSCGMLLFFTISSFYPVFGFILCLIILFPNNILQIYSCVNVVSIILLAHSRLLPLFSCEWRTIHSWGYSVNSFSYFFVSVLSFNSLHAEHFHALIPILQVSFIHNYFLKAWVRQLFSCVLEMYWKAKTEHSEF